MWPIIHQLFKPGRDLSISLKPQRKAESLIRLYKKGKVS